MRCHSLLAASPKSVTETQVELLATQKPILERQVSERKICSIQEAGKMVNYCPKTNSKVLDQAGDF